VIYRLTIDAFHATPEVARACELFSHDRQFGKSRISLRGGGLDAAVAYYQNNATPQVVIVEEVSDDRAMLERLGRLAEVCVAGTRVVVIGTLNDIAVYRTLIAQGVSEYLIAPVSAAQIAGAIEAIFADPKAQPRGRMIAFFGARGGVGSSTLAHNVAWSMAQQTAEEVVLLDLDRAFGTVGLAFNTESRQTVSELLGEPDRIDAQMLDRILLKYDERLHLLPSPSELRPWPPIEVEAIDKLLDLVRQMTPFVVLDLPHHWEPWIVHALEAADVLVVTATPDLPNLRDTKNLLDTVGPRRGDRMPIQVVLNRMDALKKSQLTSKDFEETLKIAPALSLPFDPLFGEASNNGQMLGEVAKTSKIAESIAQFALSLSGRQAAPSRKPSPTDALTAWLKKAKLVK